MIDKLPLIKKLAQTKGIKIDAQIDDRNTDEENKELKEYMIRVSLVHNYIKNLNMNTAKLDLLKSELPNAFADKEKECSVNIDHIIEDSLTLQQQIKSIIDTSSITAKEFENNPMMLEQEKRIIANMQGSVIKHFQDAVTDYQMVQSEIKNIKQNKTVRNAEIVMGRKLGNDEKENIINDPKIIQDMLKSKLTDPASNKFANALSDLEDRHNDIIKLEKSVNQVHQMFLQLAALVNLQGELIENISDNIEKAKCDVLVAEDDVIKSKNNMISARKKKCCIIITVLIILVFIVGPVLGIKLGSI